MKKNNLNKIEKPGFKVPENYFENFEDLLLSELNLKEASGDTGFKIPEGYFDSFDNKIINAVAKEKETKVIKLFSYRKVAYVASIAACIIFMFSIAINKEDYVTIDTIETASIENYILNEYMEPTDIASLFSSDELNDFDTIGVDFNSESLENYVIENIEIDDLISK